MNSLLDEDTEDDLDDRPVQARDREITLGTTMVLGIFFALAAYGAVLFGFGYSMGVKHLTSTPAVGSEAGTTNFSGFKPPPGSPLGTQSAAIATTLPTKPTPGPSVTVADTPVSAAVTPKPLPAPRPEPTAPIQAAAPAPRTPPAPTPATPAQPPASALVQPTAAGSFLVQVAAVSHQEDADLLVVTLKRRGYPVAIKHEPQDSLLHVQIGNFTNKKDADAMRQRLLADGFNAIVK